MNDLKGQVAIPALLGIASLIAAVGAPILWVSDIKAQNTVQDNEIVALKAANEELKTDVKELRKGMNALLWKAGINPDSLETKK